MCEIVLRECIRCTCGSSFCEHILVYCQYRAIWKKMIYILCLIFSLTTLQSLINNIHTTGYDPRLHSSSYYIYIFVVIILTVLIVKYEFCQKCNNEFCIEARRETFYCTSVVSWWSCYCCYTCIECKKLPYPEYPTVPSKLEMYQKKFEMKQHNLKYTIKVLTNEGTKAPWDWEIGILNEYVDKYIKVINQILSCIETNPEKMTFIDNRLNTIGKTYRYGRTKLGSFYFDEIEKIKNILFSIKSAIASGNYSSDITRKHVAPIQQNMNRHTNDDSYHLLSDNGLDLENPGTSGTPVVGLKRKDSKVESAIQKLEMNQVQMNMRNTAAGAKTSLKKHLQSKRRLLETGIKAFSIGNIHMKRKTIDDRRNAYVAVANEYMQMIDVRDTNEKEQFLNEHNAFLNQVDTNINAGQVLRQKKLDGKVMESEKKKLKHRLNVKRKSVENTIKVFTKGGTKAPTAFAIKTFKERTDQYVELANEYLQMIDVRDTYAKEQFLKEHNAFLNDTQNKMDNAKKKDFLANVPNNMKPGQETYVTYFEKNKIDLASPDREDDVRANNNNNNSNNDNNNATINTTSSRSLAEEIKSLKQMKDDGMIDEAEFKAAKAKLLQ